MKHTKIYVICDGAKGGIDLLAPLRPEIVHTHSGMLEPDGTFVGVVYPNEAIAREVLAQIDGITVLPSHISRGSLCEASKSKIDAIGAGAHGIEMSDDGYAVATKLHAYYKSISPPESRCRAALDPDA
jgi:hypothetical protein